MSELYKPILQSGAYTNEWARRRGVTPEELDPGELVGRDFTLRRRNADIVSELIEENLKICGPDGRVSLPTYPLKRLLPKSSEDYHDVVRVLHGRYLEAVRAVYGTEDPQSLVRLFSVGFTPDGYVPKRGESVMGAYISVRPQLKDAAQFRYRPIVEATTTESRLLGAWRAANDEEIPEIDVGLAFDSHGHLAADGATLAQLLDLMCRNKDHLTTKIVLGANCGSLTGIEKAATVYPHVLQFAYANNVDIQDLDHLEDVGNGCIHHHGEPVTVEEVARVGERYGIPVLSLCCGFGPDDLEKLKTLTAKGVTN